MAYDSQTQKETLSRAEVAATGALSLGNTVAVTNKASGGTIGTAAATVDVARIITLNQTTAGQTVTIPDPTATTVVRDLYFINIGSQSVTVLGAALAAGIPRHAVWTGTAWKTVA